MFYEAKIRDRVKVAPEFLGKGIKKSVKEAVINAYERRMIEGKGFIFLIKEVEVVGDGKVFVGDPNVYYDVIIDSVIYQPFVNEIVKTKVEDITSFGAFCNLGVLSGLLHLSQIRGEKFSFDRKNKALVSKNYKITKRDVLTAKITVVSLKENIKESKIALNTNDEGLGKESWYKKKVKK